MRLAPDMASLTSLLNRRLFLCEYNKTQGKGGNRKKISNACPRTVVRALAHALATALLQTHPQISNQSQRLKLFTLLCLRKKKRHDFPRGFINKLAYENYITLTTVNHCLLPFFYAQISTTFALLCSLFIRIVRITSFPFDGPAWR